MLPDLVLSTVAPGQSQGVPGKTGNRGPRNTQDELNCIAGTEHCTPEHRIELASQPCARLERPVYGQLQPVSLICAGCGVRCKRQVG